jgi:hypothetical protein
MKRKVNIKVIIFSLIALGFLALTFLVDWLFIIGAVVFMLLNQREIMHKRKS